jgi:hypothetical protein
MPSVTVYKDVEVEIEVDIEDFEDYQLQEELERRGLTDMGDPAEVKELLEKIWELRRLEQPYDHLVDLLLYETIGKIL